MIRARGVCKVYNHRSSRLEVLKDINLDIAGKETVAIVGPSGAGKSTLLHILGGLDTPTRGRVFIDGRDIGEMSSVERLSLRNQTVGFVFQFYHLLPEFTARENVFVPALVGRGVRRKEAKERAQELLEGLGLKERLGHRPQELSGGEQQRVAIARALINNPRVLFCDEPTGNLDRDTGERILDILFSLGKDRGTAVVLVTHNEQISRLCPRVVHMEDGKIMLQK